MDNQIENWIKPNEPKEAEAKPIFPPINTDNPKCIWCTAPTQRTGSCHTCIQCGSTTSCG